MDRKEDEQSTGADGQPGLGSGPEILPLGGFSYSFVAEGPVC